MRVMPPVSRMRSIWLQSSLRFLHHDLADRLALLEQVPAALLELLARDVELHALAVVAVDDRRARAAGELDLRGQRAVVEILVALQIEQRIFAVHACRTPPPPS